MITKIQLDELVEKYETFEFIKNDPIQFLHRFKAKKDIELAGFIASLLSYGSRVQFIKKLEELFVIMQNEPLNFIQNFDKGMLMDFNYRFGKPKDFVAIFELLKILYNTTNGLEELFNYGRNQGKMFECVVDYFYNGVLISKRDVGQGFYHMIPNPRNGGAMKRMCMLLRWLVRKSSVDLGVWNFIKPSELYIPLDVHVGRISRKMGLLTRKVNDFKSVIELTEKLKNFCPEDPVKYDFAMFGLGVDKESILELQ
jgi:uncharacterized protein (TIGR02757 family)